MHLNLLKAQMVFIPEEYKWSSYEALMGEKSKLCNTEIVLSYFKNSYRHKLKTNKDVSCLEQ